MKFSNEIWAVVPARSGSKSIKHKNIKMPKVVSASKDGKMLFVGTNDTIKYGIHKFQLK